MSQSKAVAIFSFSKPPTISDETIWRRPAAGLSPFFLADSASESYRFAQPPNESVNLPTWVLFHRRPFSSTVPAISVSLGVGMSQAGDSWRRRVGERFKNLRGGLINKLESDRVIVEFN